MRPRLIGWTLLIAGVGFTKILWEGYERNLSALWPVAAGAAAGLVGLLLLAAGVVYRRNRRGTRKRIRRQAQIDRMMNFDIRPKGS